MRAIYAAVIGIVAVALGIFTFISRSAEVTPPALAAASAPVSLTDVEFGVKYSFVKMETFAKQECPNGRAVSFFFADHKIRSQYICETNVADIRTERSRKVSRKLTYSHVSFWKMADRTLDGLKASNVEIIRYDLVLRRPLRPVPNPRPGGPAR